MFILLEAITLLIYFIIQYPCQDNDNGNFVEDHSKKEAKNTNLRNRKENWVEIGDGVYLSHCNCKK